ncbi:hypothetical protein ASG01_02215 [Chryseobacterium sp. Leaf180]|uniref:murein L,D-transpeptidase catalytic domain-containing protein n=1 Tax=Chryseobacterium sp. Leaf180 TaxID=1736289 RepID=UPI0006F2BF2D|nr:murein L,D-transpeptidase catalytic domain family protein [Chryseobacterium sp. Leaf180]KQR94712.1 hypothetical protein ASG01_02215 [Chryseobacterium sp. Leaf180]
MKKFLLIFLCFLFTGCDVKSQSAKNVLPENRVQEMREFLQNSVYNQDVAVFINFKIHSGKFRYFVYDLKNNRILQQATVSHGSGSVIKNSENLRFSNTENSYQSSLGFYKISESYEGNFGKSYRLDGLSATNSKARERAIVLHPYKSVNDFETSTHSALSLGCPMLSPKAFLATAKILDDSKNNILLYAFY